jgi:hypothetical protein
MIEVRSSFLLELFLRGLEVRRLDSSFLLELCLKGLEVRR